MRILVTGGAGFIGSHTVTLLLEEGYDVTVVDNFSNSNKNVLQKIKDITKKEFDFYEGSVCDQSFLNEVFKKDKIDAVIHFAAYKAVGESVEKPLMYYDNNLTGVIKLLEVMEENNVNKFIFSSSATVYGTPQTLPIKEDFEVSATNPYGYTKLMTEQIIKDLAHSNAGFSAIILRYFNPIGAHPSGLIGEKPNGIPNNLMPYIMKVATGELEKVHVFGNDYDTKDGTGVRDYIHVMDLAKGHIKALEYLEKNKGVDIFNLGTGTGYSVLELINAVKDATGLDISYVIDERRPGDIAACYADATKAKEKLQWQAKKTLKEMCEDSYNFIVRNKQNL